MAPNKKKKKPVGNPARGFATTSTASKNASIEAANGAKDLPKTEEQAAKSPSVEGRLPSDVREETKPTHELTPEELEAHLEESDLQVILDSNSSRVQQICTRQSSRLKTERRLLRHQAEALNTLHSLPPELLGEVFDFLRTKKYHVTSLSSQPASDESNLSDELLVNVWCLKSTFLDLGFLSEQIDEALKFVFAPGLNYEHLLKSIPRDQILGFDECLDFLAFHVAEQSSQNYELPKIEMVKDVDAIPVSTPSVVAELEPVKEQHVVSDENQAAEPISDLESDMEPDQMVERYISLKARLHAIDPKQLHFQKKGRKHAQWQTNETTNKTAKRVQDQLRLLSSDVLFDVENAEMLWTLKHIELMQQDASERSNGAEQATSADDSPQTKTLGDMEAETSEDTAMMVGDMFSSLPDAVDGNTGESENSSVSLRSFRSWNGLSPRRVLEEAVKASRDTSAEVQYRVTAETSFTCRHLIDVQWSKEQDLKIVVPFAAIRSAHSRRKSIIEMVDVACPDRTQSEAFVSTVALFQIFSQSPKEEKCYLRLPPVWKDLWLDMSHIIKDKDDAVSRETLRSLRAIMRRDASHEVTDVKDSAIKPDVQAQNSTAEQPQRVQPEALKHIWGAKTGSPAYRSMLSSREQLPIYGFKEVILRSISQNQVVIVCGTTGCGKSTQVPSYIMENELSNGRDCKVYCTEPRRISAISLARRVSEELGERRNEVGTARSLVGFAVRLDSRVNSSTRLVYATTGIVMRMLESSRSLDEVTHLVLDEVHERSIESDFLLIILRKLLIKRPTLKVVLMSATVDAEKFSRYLGDAPVFEVPGRTYPVQVQYLEDVIENTHYAPTERPTYRDDADDEIDHDLASSAIGDLGQYSSQTRSTIAKFNEYRLDYDLIIKVVEYIQSECKEYNKATLVFLPGIAEIRRLNNMLLNNPGLRCEVFALHSSIATEEQERAFLPPAKGRRKIVLATNIAETGITIPDITCVIDAGKHKEMRYDERRQLSRLIPAFISKANAVQRRGRAGRVQKGLCFHLFSKQRFEKMAAEQTPEMLRLSLQDLVLRVKLCRLGSIEETLAEALDPPAAKNVRRAVDALQDVKALTATQEMTPLGRQLAKLPLDVFLGKLIILGSTFGCLDATLTIAAIISSKSPFTTTIGSQGQADQARMSFKRSDSDLLTVYNAYSGWRKVCSTAGSEQQLCRKNCLSVQTLGNIEDLKSQLMSSMADAGFVSLDHEESSALRRAGYHHGHRSFVPVPIRYNSNDNDLIINSAIASAFYPKLLRREGKGWRNVSTNQTVSLHPTSVNKHTDRPPKWLSFYHIMASGSRYNAHETSAVDDLALILLCGEADFKMYAGVIVIDNNRARFVIQDWRTMVVLKSLRSQIRGIIDKHIQSPGTALSEEQRYFLTILYRVFTRGKNDVPLEMT